MSNYSNLHTIFNLLQRGNFFHRSDTDEKGECLALIPYKPFTKWIKYRKTPNKRPPPINAPPLWPRLPCYVFFNVFGYISARNGPIFIP